jgi:hypothetical protein
MDAINKFAQSEDDFKDGIAAISAKVSEMETGLQETKRSIPQPKGTTAAGLISGVIGGILTGGSGHASGGALSIVGGLPTVLSGGIISGLVNHNAEHNAAEQEARRVMSEIYKPITLSADQSVPQVSAVQQIVADDSTGKGSNSAGSSGGSSPAGSGGGFALPGGANGDGTPGASGADTTTEPHGNGSSPVGSGTNDVSPSGDGRTPTGVAAGTAGGPQLSAAGFDPTGGLGGGAGGGNGMGGGGLGGDGGPSSPYGQGGDPGDTPTTDPATAERTAAGQPGSSGFGMPGGRGKKDDETTHKSAEYLRSTQHLETWFTEDMRGEKALPVGGVIGNFPERPADQPQQPAQEAPTQPAPPQPRRDEF